MTRAEMTRPDMTREEMTKHNAKDMTRVKHHFLSSLAALYAVGAITRVICIKFQKTLEPPLGVPYRDATVCSLPLRFATYGVISHARCGSRPLRCGTPATSTHPQICGFRAPATQTFKALHGVWAQGRVLRLRGLKHHQKT